MSFLGEPTDVAMISIPFFPIPIDVSFFSQCLRSGRVYLIHSIEFMVIAIRKSDQLWSPSIPIRAWTWASFDANDPCWNTANLSLALFRQLFPNIFLNRCRLIQSNRRNASGFDTLMPLPWLITMPCLQNCSLNPLWNASLIVEYFFWWNAFGQFILKLLLPSLHRHFRF